jgi:uncharacterized protein HemX
MIIDLALSAPSGADDAATTTVPTPQNPATGMSDESTAITAGLGGFLVVFALGLAVWFLGRDLTRRLRRMNRVEEQRAEDAGRARGAGPGASGQGPVTDEKDPLA